MRRHPIVLCAPSFAAIGEELARLGRCVRTDERPRDANEIGLFDLRDGRSPPAGPRIGLWVGWFGVEDVTPEFDPVGRGVDDFIAGPLTAGRLLARLGVLARTHAAEVRYALLQRALPEAIWDLDVETGRIEWSTGLRDVFGHAAPASLDDWASHIHPAERATVMAKFEEAIARDDAWTDEYRFRHADGQYRPTLDRGVVLRDGAGRAVRMVGAMTDVSARRLATEKLAQAEHIVMMGAVAAGIAHELNNPLAVVSARLERLNEALDHGDTHAARREVADTARALARVEAIAADLQFATRASDGGSADVDVEVAIASALALVRNELRHRARVVRHVAALPRVVGSEPRLVQVLVNLLRNAALAVGEGRASHNEIRIDARPIGHDVIVTVTDTGIGMSPAVLARVFEPFYGLSDGPGLGLPIARDIARGMGGELTLESVPGGGTTATLRLVPSPARAAPLPVSRTKTELTVLILDDEDDLRNVMVAALAPHRVASEATAAAALARLRDGERFDAIVCDLMMPDVTGMDFYAEVVALDPAQAARVGFVTGGAFTPSAQAFVAAHPGRTLEKPFRLTELVAFVARLAERHST